MRVFYLILERDPEAAAYTFLTSKVTGGKILVFPSTLRLITAKLADLQKEALQYEAAGPDTLFKEEVISAYSLNQLIVCIRRINNSVGVYAQMKYDAHGRGTKSFFVFVSDISFALSSLDSG